MQHSIFHVQDSVLCKALPARFSLSAALRPKQRAIFLDKDGTLIEDVPYNVDPARLRFTPRAFEALHLWRDAGYRFVVVTNQSGLHQGRFDRAALSALHNALEAQLAQGGITLDGFFACPHLEDEKCECRKPQPGLLLEAARMLNLDFENSWMVGDILNDVEAGQRAGCRSVLLDVGHETEWISGPLRIPELRCKDLLEAARTTLKSSGQATHVADDVRIEAFLCAWRTRARTPMHCSATGRPKLIWIYQACVMKCNVNLIWCRKWVGARRMSACASR